jgi:sulfatase modifying factor 1
MSGARGRVAVRVIAAAALLGMAGASGCGLVFPTYLAGDAGADGTASDASVDGPVENESRDAGGDPSTDVPGDAAPSDVGSDAPEAGKGEAASDASNDGNGDAGIVVPPSCAPGGWGMTDCGEAGTESCCTSPNVMQGAFDRTYSASADGGVSGTGDPASISAFRLDKYEVTVGRFRQFVNAWNGGAGWVPGGGSGTHAYLNGGKGLTQAGTTSGSYEPGWNSADDTNIAPTTANLTGDSGVFTWSASAIDENGEKLPIDWVNWYEAYAFCIWDGGFLPSDAELAYAAAGGNQQREYPWGWTDPGNSYAYANYGCFYPGPGSNCQGGSTNIAPVGAAASGAGRWGQLDLQGNLWEWALDLYSVPYANPCIDCGQFSSGSNPVYRSTGAFGNSKSFLASDERSGIWAKGDREPAMGFRCARAP